MGALYQQLDLLRDGQLMDWCPLGHALDPRNKRRVWRVFYFGSAEAGI